MVIYRHPKNLRTLQTEKKGEVYIIVMRDFWGDSIHKEGPYESRTEAEEALEEMADEQGFRFLKKVGDADVSVN